MPWPPETRMSFRVDLSPVTGNTPPTGKDRRPEMARRPRSPEI